MDAINALLLLQGWNEMAPIDLAQRLYKAGLWEELATHEQAALLKAPTPLPIFYKLLRFEPEMIDLNHVDQYFVPGPNCIEQPAPTSDSLG